MNKRQAKKNYKKRCGHNPPVKNPLYKYLGIDPMRIQDLLCEALARFKAWFVENANAAEELPRINTIVTEAIQNLDEDQFEDLLKSLPEVRRQQALSMRKEERK